MKNLPVRQSNFLLYTSQKGKININVVLFNETVWLNRHQMAELYDRDIKTIGKHINNIFKEE